MKVFEWISKIWINYFYLFACLNVWCVCGGYRCKCSWWPDTTIRCLPLSLSITSSAWPAGHQVLQDPQVSAFTALAFQMCICVPGIFTGLWGDLALLPETFHQLGVLAYLQGSAYLSAARTWIISMCTEKCWDWVQWLPAGEATALWNSLYLLYRVEREVKFLHAAEQRGRIIAYR